MSEKFIKLLLVEGNFGDAFLLQQKLSIESQVNFKLIHVHNLEEAMTRLKEESFDVVLLELILPDILKIRPLSTLLKLKEQFPSVPIVVLTGIENEKLVSQAREHGVDNYFLKKDFSTEILVNSFFNAMSVASL